MEEQTPQAFSQASEGTSGTLARTIGRLRTPEPIRTLRASPFAAACAAALLAVVLIGALTYYGARRFTGHAANVRASNEASSFAAHSGKLATGDAFDGYIQILRYAEDPVVAARTATNGDRIAAMQRLLYLNTNKFASLTIADRSGLVLASTDPSIQSVRDSQVFAETRANLGPANSDVVLPQAGARGYVEYSAPLKEPDGSTWAILVARADPERLFRSSLAATVDGGRNVIINSQGQFAAGVPGGLLGEPWRGSYVGDGGVRASIVGVDSICGLAPIGKDTQIDRGLNVASCLPTSLIQAEQAQAMDKQGLVTVAGAVLALVLAGGLLRFALTRGGASTTGAALADEAADRGDATLEESLVIEPDAASVEPAMELPEPELAPPQIPPPVVIQADVDSAALIEAYEARNARLAARLRESVQARLLVATTRAETAFREATQAEAAPADRAEGEPDETSTHPAGMHADAIARLEIIREHDLRAIGQELHPGLVRLGLGAALRGLQKDLADEVELELDIESGAALLGVGPEGLVTPLRLVMYRFVLDAARALADPDHGVRVAIDSDEEEALSVRVESEGSRGIDERALAATAIALEAYGGRLSIEQAGGTSAVVAIVPHEAIAAIDRTPPVADSPPDELLDGEIAPNDVVLPDVVDAA